MGALRTEANSASKLCKTPLNRLVSAWYQLVLNWCQTCVKLKSNQRRIRRTHLDLQTDNKRTAGSSGFCTECSTTSILMEILRVFSERQLTANAGKTSNLIKTTVRKRMSLASESDPGLKIRRVRTIYGA